MESEGKAGRASAGGARASMGSDADAMSSALTGQSAAGGAGAVTPSPGCPPPTPHKKAPKDLPRSDGDLGVPLHLLDKIVQCHSTLRGFGFMLRLSPFTLQELCRSLAADRVTPLVDEIHTCLLVLLQLSPPMTEEELGPAMQHSDGREHYLVTVAVHELVKDPSWRFLDTLTWQDFLSRYLAARGALELADMDVAKYLASGEHCVLPLEVKVDVLRFLCDELLDSPMVRRELCDRSDNFALCLDNEKAEVKDKRLVEKKIKEEGAEQPSLLPQYSHLHVRDGLDGLEIEFCDLAGVGGNLVCCDGCPASYLSKSVGLKRLGDDKEKWFCEECRVGGQTRVYRMMHRDSPAVIWADIPSLASFGSLQDDITVFSAHGRLFVGRENDLYAYYSNPAKVDEVIAFLASRPRPTHGPVSTPAQKKGSTVKDTPASSGSRSKGSAGKKKGGAGGASGSTKGSKSSPKTSPKQKREGSKRERKTPTTYRDPEEDEDQDMEQSDEEEVDQVLKRGRGRPRKEDSAPKSSSKKNTGGKKKKKKTEDEDEEEDLMMESDESDYEAPSGKRKAAKGKKKYEDDDDWDEATQDEDHDPCSALKFKKKALLEQFAFRSAVEEKAQGREYVNKYSGAFSITEVQQMISKKDYKPRKDKAAKKWDGWPRLQLESASDTGRTGLLLVASYLVQVEKSMQGLMEGPFLKQGKRRDWGQGIKCATEIGDVGSAAMEFESALRKGVMIPQWETSDPPMKKRRRPGRMKGETVKKKPEVDWKEVSRVEGFEECAAFGEDSDGDEADDAPFVATTAFAGGIRSSFHELHLSKAAIRSIVLTAGETEYTNMVYRKDKKDFYQVMPTNRLRWICGILNAKTVAQLAIQVRVLDECINWEAVKKPEVTKKTDLSTPIIEKAVDKRLVAGREGFFEYAVKNFGDDERIIWMPEDKVPLYCIREFESDARKAARASWWRDFEFYPGAGVEVQFEGDWYQAFVVENVDQKPNNPSRGGSMPLNQFKEGIGMVKVHYIGGREEEDEWISKDSDLLREDRKANDRVRQDVKRKEADKRKVAHIKDKEERMRLRLELFQERKRLRVEQQRSAKDREKEREEERARKDNMRSERVRMKEAELDERRREREEKIRLRKLEQEKKKEDNKLIKKLAQEKQRILQGKSSWWRDFPWTQGVMVEMDWEGEWFDCTVIKLLGPDPEKPQVWIEGERAEKEREEREEKEAEARLRAEIGVDFEGEEMHEPLSQVDGDDGVADDGDETEGGKVTVAAANDKEASGGKDAAKGQGTGDGNDSADDKDSVDGKEAAKCESVADGEGASKGKGAADGKDSVDGKDCADGMEAAKGESTTDGDEAEGGGSAPKTPVKKKKPTIEEKDIESWKPYLTSRLPGPKIIYPKGWPEDSVFVCEEDDRPIDVARKFRVNLERLVRLNKKAYPSLTKLSALKQGTLLRLPLPIDVNVAARPKPPDDPMNVGVVLVHYVGGTEHDTEWVFRCCKQMRPSADKLWNSISAEANEETQQLCAPDPDAWKKHCRKVLKRVKKHDKAWPFWEPVDPVRDGIEDYFDVVKQPMCLDRVEEKLDKNEYAVVEEFSADMKLTFNNAIVYNPEDHPFHGQAKDLLAFFEEAFSAGNDKNNWNQPYSSAASSALISDKLKGYTPKQDKGEGGSSKKKAAAKEGKAEAASEQKEKKEPKTPMEIRLNQTGKEEIRKVVEKLISYSSAEDFLEPVSLKIAPDYLDVIKKPMDLGQVRDKANDFKYQTARAVKRDVDLIVSNALQYNLEGDEVCKAAQTLQKHADKLFTKLEATIAKIEANRDAEAPAPKEKATPKDSKAVAEASSTPGSAKQKASASSSESKKKDKDEGGGAAPEPKGGWESACLALVKKLAKHKDSWPFTEPVDAEALKLKDYHKVIKKPMDFGTIQGKLEEGVYKNKVSTQFPADCRLVLQNAMTYNDDGDPIYICALKMKAVFEESWAHMLEDLVVPTSASKAKKPDPAEVKGGSTKKEAATDGKSKLSVETPKSHAKKEKEEVLEPEGGWDAACLVIVKKLAKLKDAWPFLEPVDADALKLKDYHKVIKKPMDLGTIQAKLEEGTYKSKTSLLFPSDCRLVFQNAMTYNDEGDDIHELAAKMWDKFDEQWNKLTASVSSTNPAANSVGKAADPGSKSGGKAKEVEEPPPKKKKAKMQQEEEMVELEDVVDVPAKAPVRKDWRPPCAKLLTRLITDKDGFFFLEKVDPKALKLRDYAKVVKHPMDFGTIDQKMKSEAYKSPEEFASDVRLTLSNAIMYNTSPEHPVHQSAVRLSALFEDRWDKLSLVATEAPPMHAMSDGKGGKEKAKGQKAAVPEEEAEEDAEFVPLPPGTEVQMLFDDGKWYKGSIEKYFPGRGNYRIIFPDGDVQNAKVPGKECVLVTKGKKGSGAGGDKREGGGAEKRKSASGAVEEVPPQKKERKSDVAEAAPAAATGSGKKGGDKSAAKSGGVSERKSDLKAGAQAGLEGGKAASGGGGGSAKRKRAGDGAGEAGLGLHEDPEANLGRKVMVTAGGEAKEGFLIKYLARSGKYRVLFEDGGESDFVLPDKSVKMMSTDEEETASKKKKR